MRRHPPARRREHGAALIEALVVLPVFFFSVLSVMQTALVYYTKSCVNYATHEAARAGTVHGASLTAINFAFQKAMVPYYGGGSTPAELADTLTHVVQADLTDAVVRVEILSPTQESFTDYNSPALQAALHETEKVIPNSALDELTCPRDVPGCANDPETNASGQTLLDANLLKLRVTYGIPPKKQMPLVGAFYVWSLDKLGVGDPFEQALLAANRIPVVTSTVMRMQSDAVLNSAMVSSPGKGNDGHPKPPDPPASSPGLPTCPWWDPSCISCPDGTDSCSPETCTPPP